MAEPPELDSPEAFLELARKVSLAPELLDALGPLGYRTIADFGYSLPTLDTLNGLLEIIPQEVWDSLHAPQPALHPATGRLRRLLERCHQAITMHSPTASHAHRPPEPAAPRAACTQHLGRACPAPPQQRSRAKHARHLCLQLSGRAARPGQHA